MLDPDRARHPFKEGEPMYRIIPCTLSLALVAFCAVALAEDQAQPRAQQPQDSQQDQAADRDARAADELAQPAAARGRAAQGEAGEKDPAAAFANETWSHNQFEVQLGQLAAQRAQDDQIKQFARMMVADHTKANQQLKQIAQSGNIQISEKLDPVHQAKLEKFQQCQGPEFERKYINSQAAGHMMSVLEFRWQSQNQQNEQLKQYAAQTLPKLEQHFAKAGELANQQAGGGEARPAAAREAGSSDAAAQPGQSREGRTGRDAAGQQRDAEGADAAGQP